MHDDEYGFRLEGMTAHCLHCPAGGASRDWPQWKRSEHFKREHRRDVLRAERKARVPNPSRPPSKRRTNQRHRSKEWVAAHQPRPCRECGKSFEPRTARQVFCSDGCRKRYAYEQPKRDAKRRDGMVVGGRQATSNLPRSNGGLRVTNGGSRPPICPRCRQEFEPARTSQQYCSSPCRQAAYRERQATVHA
jgi:hypothetical protein